MKLVGDAHRFHHSDGVGLEMVIDRIAHLIGGQILFQIHMGDLPEGMDTGIGAPCAIDLARSAIEPGRRSLERALNGRAVLLALPAHEWAAIILDGELVARHG